MNASFRQLWGGDFDYIFSVNSLETFIDESERSYALIWGGEPFEIHFADGFDESGFYYDDIDLTIPIPVIVHQQIFESRGLTLGDIAFMGRHQHFPKTYLEDGSILMYPYITVRVIGVYSGHTVGGRFHSGDGEFVVMPIDALRFIRRESMTYSMVRAYIDPAKNHYIEEFEERMEESLQENRIQINEWVIHTFPLQMTINDDEFRMIVTPMEHNLALLELLYPIAIAAVVVLGFSMSLILMSQQAINSAVMRVIGSTKLRIRVLLIIELMLLTVTGVAVALVLMPLLNMGFSHAFLYIAGLYLAGVFAGGVLGAVLVSRRQPLELLQVRE
jgi:hypothetical protein